ncbi:MAG TPA: glycosyltransferase, partial [Prolixibacteraceae bacterium]|nr:glycosyltransferase [Prolixibacteraceae bacterium]
MIIIGYILFVFLLVHFGVILYNYLSKPFLPTPNDNIPYPKISILIPARNEEKNLPDILNDLSNLHYNNYEVIVCNDHSTDGTLNVLEKAITHFPHLKFFTNKPLPYLWMGKNFACHQLSKNATGEWF